MSYHFSSLFYMVIYTFTYLTFIDISTNFRIQYSNKIFLTYEHSKTHYSFMYIVYELVHIFKMGYDSKTIIIKRYYICQTIGLDVKETKLGLSFDE